MRQFLLNTPHAIPLVTLGVLIALFSVLQLLPIENVSDGFISFRNVFNILTPVATVALVTIGITMLMIVGEFDLSIGPILAVSGYVFGWGMTTSTLTFGLEGGFDLFGLVVSYGGLTQSILSVLLAVSVGAALGALNGYITITTRVPSFIVTLGTRFVYTGLSWVFATFIVGQAGILSDQNDRKIYDIINGRPEWLENTKSNVNAYLRSLPEASLFDRDNFNISTGIFWTVLILLLFIFIMKYTKFGSYVHATGGNPDAASALGVNTKKIKLQVFSIVGALAGLAGVFWFSEFGSIQASSGTGYELFAIGGAVVGGTLLTGGYGTVLGGFIGITIIYALRQGVIFAGFPSDNLNAVVGAAIIVTAISNVLIRRYATQPFSIKKNWGFGPKKVIKPDGDGKINPDK